MKRSHFAIFAASLAFAASAEIPLDYYSELHGKCGAELKDAIYNTIGAADDITMLKYGSGNNSTWWGFYVTDRRDDNTVIDRYSNETFYFGERGSSVTGMNIEHSFAKSWWGGTTSVNSYKDLYNLMPCESKINNAKSNYPMGLVTGATTTNGNNGCTKVGKGSDGNNYWEPADEWKGDFARGYMYMATAYQNLTWTGDNTALLILENNTYPTLKESVSALYCQWARTDRVSELEVTRNEIVSSIQNNRNPYVDFPNLMEYVWGDSVTVPLNIYTTVKSGPATGYIDNHETAVTLYENTLLGDEGGFTVEYNVRPSGNFVVWKNNASYGWTAKATKTVSGVLTYLESDAKLVSPEIDLTKYRTITATFDHACNYAASPADVHSVYVRTDDGTETPVAVANWPSGSNWTFVSSGDIDLSPYSGKKVHLVFRYTSTPEEASTWEIKNLSVKGKGDIGVTTIPSPVTDPLLSSDTPTEYYSLDGCRVNPATYHGIAIMRRGSTVVKLLLR